MLFFEPVFLFIFLPITMGFYYILRIIAPQEYVIVMLALASLIFYGWYNPQYTFVILGSIIFNYLCGSQLLLRAKDGKGCGLLLFFGVAMNLVLLGFFKYLPFIAQSLEIFFYDVPKPATLDLPLGISFFTFLQIAYLVDCARSLAKRNRFLHYLLFVTFFPHLLAGPLIHHRELIPQFSRKNKRIWGNLAIGLTIFSIGLFKKLVPAQQMANWANPVFDGISVGIIPSFIEAWIGALCFALQIYFDFSGYSDMAIGLSRIFGIYMPVNFASPYKAANIIEFWRRWHITLSRFFRDYLYIPLGGNRIGIFWQMTNLIFVMLLVGLWHGAGWKFIVWGAVHGLFLVVCHVWVNINGFFDRKLVIPNILCVALTFLVVVIAWVPFRADSLTTSLVFFESMIGLNGIKLPSHYAEIFFGIIGRLSDYGVIFSPMTSFAGGFQLAWIMFYLGIIWFTPNTQEIMRFYHPALVVNNRKEHVKSWPALVSWRPAIIFGVFFGILLSYLMILSIQGNSGEFIYFQF
jgi:alginate O-acetyltransferase complex protein AlgI